MNGVVEAEAEKEGVPNFWLIAMKTNEMLANEITERDEEISSWSFSLILIFTSRTRFCLKLTM